MIHKCSRQVGFVSAGAAVTCPVCRECDIYIYIYIYVCVCVCVNIYMCMCVYIYIFAFFGHFSLILFIVLKFYAIISLKKE